ncbi:MAG TPA: DUF541 domain-containing protein [Thiotrichales bacterium]|nr:DUF541 domain-containing protein [Thiotrichales bacterium]
MDRRWWLAALLLIGWIVNAHVPAGAAPAEGEGSRVSFRVEVQREVTPDRMRVRMRATAEAEQPARVQNEINARMQAARRVLESSEGITVGTGQYRIHPVYRKERIIGWRGSQDLLLESGDFARLAEVMGRLQAQGLAVQEVSYLISEPLRRRIESDLVDEAVAAFRARARQLATDFGARRHTVIEASVSTGGHAPPVRPLLRAQALEAADAVPPVLAPGTRRLSASVSGSIRLAY